MKTLCSQCLTLLQCWLINPKIRGKVRANPGLAETDTGKVRENPGKEKENPGLAETNPGIVDSFPGKVKENPGLAEADTGKPGTNPGKVTAIPGLTEADTGLAEAGSRFALSFCFFLQNQNPFSVCENPDEGIGFFLKGIFVE